MKIIQDYSDDIAVKTIQVVSAKYTGDYTIQVSFDDGEEKLVNFDSFLRSALHLSISKYLNVVLFSKFKIINGNLNWNDYDMIFPVEDLYKGIID